MEPIFHFLHFSFSLHPFNRVPLLKHKPEPIKIEEAQTSISIVTRAASPISPTYTGSVISFVKAQRCRRSVKKRDPFPWYVTDNLLRPNTALPHPFLYSLSLFLYLICVFGVWVLRKLLDFSLNFALPLFPLLFGWWENNKGEVFLVCFLFIWYYYAYLLLVCLNRIICSWLDNIISFIGNSWFK